MPGQADLTFTINADEAQAANAFRALSNDANAAAAKVIASYRSIDASAAASEALQRQRSSNLVRLWNEENNSVLSLQKQRSSALIAEWMKQNAASESLQRQRSAAIIKAATELERGLGKAGAVGTKLRSETDLLIEKSQAAIRSAQSVALGAENAIGRTSTKITAAATEAESFAGRAGAAFTDLLGPIGLATGALAGMGAVAAGVTVAIFELAKSSAEFGDKIYDASQKVNFNATTLTALKVAAEQSGGSFEGLTTALGLFDKNIELAAEGSKKQAALFKALNIDTKDNQKALEGAFTALSKLANGSQQTALAMQLFGRSGKDMLGVIKQANGDLPAFIAQMEQMGLTLTDKDAEAANDFSDSLTALTRQLELVKVKIGQETLPALTHFFTELSDDLADSKGDIAAWGGAFSGATNVAIATIKSFLARPEIQALRAVLLLAATPGPPALDPESTLGEVAAGTDPENRRLSRIQAELLAKGNRDTALDKTPKTPRAPREKKTADDYGLELLARLNGQLSELNDKTEANAIGVELMTKKYQGLSEALKLQILDASVNLDVTKKQIAANKEVADFTAKSNEALRLFVFGEKTASQSLDDFIAKMKGEGVLIPDADKLRFNAVLIDTTEIIKKLDDAAEEANKHIVGLFDNAGGITQTPGLPNQGEPPDPKVFDPFLEAQKQINDRFTEGSFKADLYSGALQGIQMAASGVANAVGDAVHAFVLFGNVGTSLRKFTAELIANIAQMAAVQAVYEAAQGLAWLALNFFFPNPAYLLAATTAFESAAAFGIIAGVTIPLGRAVAGNSFNQPGTSGGSGSGGGSGGTSSSSTNNQTQTVPLNRNQPPVAEHHTVTIELAPGLIGNHLEADVQNNGKSRKVILKLIEG